jgi:hypothetical protein
VITFIISRDINSKQDVKRVVAISRQDQMAGEVLVGWVGCNKLVCVNRINDGLAWNVPSLKAHVDMVGPEDPPLSHADLDESQWIIREWPIRRCHMYPWNGFCANRLTAQASAARGLLRVGCMPLFGDALSDSY